ncbi:MAG: HpcH/HpaI aldolase/citrate lyase family protein [Vicinamibacterales bacterium]
MTQPGHPLHRLALSVAAVAAALLLTSGIGRGQEKPYLHLNPAIAKWIEGKAAIGISTSSFSLEDAQTASRSGADFVRLDMEHSPFNADTIRLYLLGMTDKRGILRKGNAQFPIAPVVRIPTYGRESSDWVVKQALDAGMMGIKFPTIDNKAEALRAVRSMRYPPRRGSKYPEPAGLRGMGAGNATWLWGIDDYNRHADVWPLNPEGDLVSIIMIESAEGVKNVDEIASVPGVGVLFVGTAGDLPASLGVAPGAPEVEEAAQKVLAACKKHNVICGGLADADDIAQRIKEGWKYIDVGRTHGGLGSGTAAALKAGQAANK